MLQDVYYKLVQFSLFLKERTCGYQGLGKINPWAVVLKISKNWFWPWVLILNKIHEPTWTTGLFTHPFRKPTSSLKVFKNPESESFIQNVFVRMWNQGVLWFWKFSRIHNQNLSTKSKNCPALVQSNLMSYWYLIPIMFVQTIWMGLSKMWYNAQIRVL